MREIKFRAWDTEKNTWYEPVHEAYKGNLHELLVGFGGDLSAHTMNGLEHESRWKGKYILMQYTGLKDKNGVEIYEGDIVQFYRVIRGRLYTVPYSIKVIKWVTTSTQNGFNFGLGRKGNRRIEVIGNIYENKGKL